MRRREYRLKKGVHARRQRYNPDAKRARVGFGGGHKHMILSTPSDMVTVRPPPRDCDMSAEGRDTRGLVVALLQYRLTVQTKPI